MGADYPLLSSRGETPTATHQQLLMKLGGSSGIQGRQYRQNSMVEDKQRRVFGDKSNL